MTQNQPTIKDDPLAKSRLAAIFARTKQVGECLEWQGGLSIHGYTQIGFRKKTYSGHRLVWQLLNRTLQPGEVIMHSCDNRRCINPAHLSAGSTSDNQRDSVRKGRHWHTRKKVCPYGHPYSGNNLRLQSSGYRRCRTCDWYHHRGLKSQPELKYETDEAPKISKAENAKRSREKAKASGTIFGRPQTWERKPILSLRNEGWSLRDIVKLTGCSYSTVQRICSL